MESSRKTTIEIVATTVQIVSVVVAGVLSVWSFNAARTREADARLEEARKPLVALKQKLYLETLHSAAVLSNPDVHTAEEMAEARKRFRELYVAELSMVEPEDVARKMVALATVVDPEVLHFKDEQLKAFELAHEFGKSFVDFQSVGAP